MSSYLNRQPDEPMSFEQYADDVAKRLPLRSVHPRLLPDIVMHHTRQRSSLLELDEWCEKIWGAGMWLASYVLKHSDEFNGKRLLDIGAGSGIVAVAAALAGAEVTALDCNVKAIYLAKINAEANGVTIKTIEQRISGQTQLPEFDILTAADIMYSGSLRSACKQAFKSETQSMFASRTFYICDQSGWSEKNFYEFRDDIVATGARFEIIKGEKRFVDPTSTVNNNPVIAVRIVTPQL